MRGRPLLFCPLFPAPCSLVVSANRQDRLHHDEEENPDAPERPLHAVSKGSAEYNHFERRSANQNGDLRTVP